jgi:polyphosphate kinase
VAREHATRFEVQDAVVFDRMLADPLPIGLRVTETVREYHRDVYLDTTDRALERRGVQCRIRFHPDDRRVLSLRVRTTEGEGAVRIGDERFVATVDETDAVAAASGTSEPARRLRAFVDPTHLQSRVALETERVVRRVGGLFGTLAEVIFDAVTVRDGERVLTFHEVCIRRKGRRGPSLEDLSRAYRDRYAVRAVLHGKLERAERRLRALESEALAQAVRGSAREVTVLAFHHGQLAMAFDGTAMSLPIRKGSGEDACRMVMRDLLGTSDARVRLLGTSAASGSHPMLEVWLAEDARRDGHLPNGADALWIGLDELMARVGSPVLRDPGTLAALSVAARSLSLVDGASVTSQSSTTSLASSTLTTLQSAELPERSLDADQPVPDQFINEQLSWIEFNKRVLELAEDPGTPLLARVQFLSIFSTNLDEFYMIRVGALKDAVVAGEARRSADGLTPEEELNAISIRLAPLIERQRRCFQSCQRDLERHGIRLRSWKDLNADDKAAMRQFFDQQIFSALTPQAMTEAPGHPFPHLPSLRLSLALMLRDQQQGPVHFAHVKIPSGLPRLVSLPDNRGLIPIEQVVANNIHGLYPGRIIDEVHAFRITRSGDINVDEGAITNLLHAMEEEVKRRSFGAVVRIEVASTMPSEMRDLLQRELRFEDTRHVTALSHIDIVEAGEFVDLGGLSELAHLPLSHLQYPTYEPRTPLDPDRSVFDTIRNGDVLMHHPYDSFEGTVQRFMTEAAHDADVVAIKLTLYRSGKQSGLIDALTHAAIMGKDVSVFVELKARFDEERNIHWAKVLEQAGIHVVTGLVKLKTHAKVALVARREGDVIRRYAHIATGNYNPNTARAYTDLGLLTCDERIGADLNDLFNELTGSSGPPKTEFRQLLVAPKHMLPQFLNLIEAEIEHARDGRGGRIRAKLNGLADREVIAALYRASQAGVEIDLIVRGICSLRPGVPGLSEHIRVYSVLGRFLEHARIFHFGNGGEDRYFVGSADWRPRNLRRRVEVVTPVFDPTLCARLDQILEWELDDATGWQMRSDGSYERPPAPVGVDRISAQERFLQRGVGSRPSGQLSL